MLPRATARRPLAWLVPSLLAGVAAALIVHPASALQPAATAEPAAAAGLVVPPLPQGTPEQLLEFVAGLMPPKAQPKSREEALAYLRGVASVSVQAADKILAGVKTDVYTVSEFKLPDGLTAVTDPHAALSRVVIVAEEAEGEAAAPGAAAEPEVLTAKKDKEGDAAAPGAKAAAPAKEAKKG
jgi:hypothetical protein